MGISLVFQIVLFYLKVYIYFYEYMCLDSWGKI